MDLVSKGELDRCQWLRLLDTILGLFILLDLFNSGLLLPITDQELLEQRTMKDLIG